MDPRAKTELAELVILKNYMNDTKSQKQFKKIISKDFKLNPVKKKGNGRKVTLGRTIESTGYFEYDPRTISQVYGYLCLFTDSTGLTALLSGEDMIDLESTIRFLKTHNHDQSLRLTYGILAAKLSHNPENALILKQILPIINKISEFYKISRKLNIITKAGTDPSKQNELSTKIIQLKKDRDAMCDALCPPRVEATARNHKPKIRGERSASKKLSSLKEKDHKQSDKSQNVAPPIVESKAENEAQQKAVTPIELPKLAVDFFTTSKATSDTEQEIQKTRDFLLASYKNSSTKPANLAAFLSQQLDLGIAALDKQEASHSSSSSASSATVTSAPEQLQRASSHSSSTIISALRTAAPTSAVQSTAVSRSIAAPKRTVRNITQLEEAVAAQSLFSLHLAFSSSLPQTSSVERQEGPAPKKQKNK